MSLYNLIDFAGAYITSNIQQHKPGSLNTSIVCIHSYLMSDLGIIVTTATRVLQIKYRI